MAYKWYDGTSAYKIEEYYDYTSDNNKKEKEEKKIEQVKTKVINHKKAIAVISLIFVIGIAFLYANAVLIQTSSQNDELKEELEDIKGKNTQTSFEITSEIDLKAVEDKAINEFGMQQPENYQNVYVDVVQSDYTQTYNHTKKVSAVEKVVDSLKSFLVYID
ncbi:MAG: hypothetical protein IJB70_00830 [Clostridia bacterium]|nr:hypothetical protein [Clostridia bacterium]